MYYNLLMKPLQSHVKLIEIQTRLNKQSYLGRGNLPGSADARMFLFLQQLKRYPDRRPYPNFYHWYVLMRQFALSSIQKWVNNNDNLEDDQMIAEFIQFKRKESESSTPEKKNTAPQATTDEQVKSPKPQHPTNIASPQIEYIIDVKIKDGIQCNMGELITYFLVHQQIEGVEIHQLIGERRVRITAKMDTQKIQQLKNKISALEGIQTFQSKKKDKKSKTVNSATKVNGDVSNL